MSSDKGVEWQNSKQAEYVGCALKFLAFLFILFGIFYNLL